MKLQHNKQLTIFHHNDNDGKSSASIAYHAYDCPHDTIFIECDYNRPVPINIPTDSTVVIVDFSVPEDVMTELLQITKDVTWIDHHVTAFRYSYNSFLKGLRLESYSACVLTYMYYHNCGYVDVPFGIKLIGDYDTWTFKYGDQTKSFQEGLKLLDVSPTSHLYSTILDSSININHIISNGEVATKCRDSYCRTMRPYGYSCMFDEYTCYMINSHLFGSHVFGDLINTHEICMAYIICEHNVRVSLYSNKIDVGAVALRYAGGGHKGASGFTMDTKQFATLFLGI